jgi:hypothetical protein
MFGGLFKRLWICILAQKMLKIFSGLGLTILMEKRNLVLFGCGAVIWAIWRSRNDCCFGDNLISDPTNVIYLCYFWLDAWAIRLKERERKLVEQGNLRIRKTISEVFKGAHGWKPIDRW